MKVDDALALAERCAARAEACRDLTAAVESLAGKMPAIMLEGAREAVAGMQDDFRAAADGLRSLAARIPTE